MSRLSSWGCVAEGVSEAGQNLRSIQGATTNSLRRGVRKWLEIVGAESQKQVPRITGRLARSMRIMVTDAPVSGTISYTAPYAGIVHEIVRPKGSNGKWKYLEDAKNALIGDLMKIVKSEIGSEIGGGR